MGAIRRHPPILVMKIVSGFWRRYTALSVLGERDDEPLIIRGAHGQNLWEGLETLESASKEPDMEIRFGIVDLAKASSVSDHDLGFLVHLWSKFHKAGGQLVIAEPNRQVVNFLNVAGLDRVFLIEESYSEALNNLISACEREST